MHPFGSLSGDNLTWWKGWGSGDKVISMGCGGEEVCPATFVPTDDWQLEGPEGQPIEKVRAIRNEIETKVKKLIEEILGNPISAQPHKTEIKQTGSKI